MKGNFACDFNLSGETIIMDMATDDKRANSDVSEIRAERIPCSREHGKLCFGQPETNLPSPPVGRLPPKSEAVMEVN